MSYVYRQQPMTEITQQFRMHSLYNLHVNQPAKEYNVLFNNSDYTK